MHAVYALACMQCFGPGLDTQCMRHARRPLTVKDTFVNKAECCKNNLVCNNRVLFGCAVDD
jgi:hypothetical protein